MRHLLLVLMASAAMLTPHNDGGNQQTATTPAAYALVVVEQGAARVTVVDPMTGKSVGSVKIGADPHEIAISTDGKLAYVSNFGLSDKDRAIGVPGDSVSVVDLTNFTEPRRLSTLPYKAPHGVKVRPGAASADQEQIFVNVEEGDLMLVFDTSGRVLRKFPVPKETHNFIFSPSGTELFLMAARNGVLRVDPETGAIQQQYKSTTAIRGLTWTADGKQLLASGKNELLFLNPTDLSVDRRIATNLTVGQILYSSMTPDGKYIFAPCPFDQKVLLIDVASGKTMRAITAGKDPIAVQIAPDRRTAFVSNASDEQLTRIDLPSMQIGQFGHVKMPNGLTFVSPPPHP